MNDAPQPFTFKPAIRDYVPLLIGIAGASGSGKTLSGLKVARGLAGGQDEKIAFIDTEAGRGKHYAVGPGEAPGPNRFAFMHGDLHPPFSPQRYIAAIAAADAAGFDVILVDSYSHSWEGEGGLHDMHDAIVDAGVEKARGEQYFNEDKVRERLSVGAWRKPKQENKRLVARLLQTRAHLIICLRADEKIHIEKVKDERTGRERTVIIQAKDMPPTERWVPICEKRFMFEMTLSLILTPQNPGIPIPIKLQEQHRAAVPLDKQLSEDTGRLLAEWARGGATSAAKDTLRPVAGEVEQHPVPSDSLAGDFPILEAAREKALEGKAAFMKWMRDQSDDDQAKIDTITDELRQRFEASGR